jgi:hypothetical protein
VAQLLITTYRQVVCRNLCGLLVRSNSQLARQLRHRCLPEEAGVESCWGARLSVDSKNAHGAAGGMQ